MNGPCAHVCNNKPCREYVRCQRCLDHAKALESLARWEARTWKGQSGTALEARRRAKALRGKDGRR